MTARFIRRFGMDAFYAPGLYPTRDGVIPFAMFTALLRADREVQASEQLSAASAVSLGAATVMGGDKPPVKAAWRKLERQAKGGA